MPSFIRDIMDSTEEFESPRRFWYWSALCAVSAVLGRQTYIDRGGAGKLYPNLYVFLYADSGLRKGPPINLAKDLVSAVGNTRVIAGRSSIEGVVKELGHSRTSPDGSLMKDARGCIIASEFASSLVESPQALTILTDLFDGHFNENWKVILKNSPTQELKNIYITLLGGINEAHFDGSIPQAAIRGGFVGRTLMIHEEDRHCINSLTEKPKKSPNKEELVKELTELSKLKGEFTWTDAAKVRYDPWYKDVSLKSKKDKTGTLQRLGDTAAKVMMLLAIANRHEFVFRLEDVEEAIEVSEAAAKFVTFATAANGSDDMAAKTQAVLKTLIKKKEVTRQQLLAGNFGKFNALDLDMIIQTFEQAGAIECKQVGKTIVYKIKQEIVDHYEKVGGA